MGIPEAADAPEPTNHATRFGLKANAVANSAAEIVGIDWGTKTPFCFGGRSFALRYAARILFLLAIYHRQTLGCLNVSPRRVGVVTNDLHADIEAFASIFDVACRKLAICS